MSLLAVAISFGTAGCRSSVSAAMQEPGSANPADANLAQVPLQGNAQQNEAVQQAGSYQNGQPTAQTNQAPVYRTNQSGQQVYQNPNAQAYPAQQQQQAYSQDPNAQYSDEDMYADQGADALDDSATYADQAPPELPQYDQPEAPGADYIWTPGYWDYASAGYYWVPGAWVYPPYVGALWTPGYWGYYGGRYRFRHGYWGPHVGFYGGINYGFGYIGFGYQGGYWNNNHFYYNRVVNRVPSRVTYIYNRPITVVNRTYINNTRVAYYGGRGGINRAPAPQERVAFHEQHVRPMTTQVQLRQTAQQNRGNFFSENRGRPQQVAFNRPLNADRGYQRPAPMPQADVNRFAMGRAVQQQQQQNGQNRPEFNRGGFGQQNQQNRPQPVGPQVAPQNRPDWNRGGNHAANVQQQIQQRQNEDQRRQQQVQQRQNEDQQRMQQRQQVEQQQQQQRQQQANVQQQQRQQEQQQRMQQMQQQRNDQVQNQQMQQRQQQMQQQMQQRQQAQQQQMQQRQVENQQRVQQMQQQQQRQVQQQQMQQMRQQQAPRMEAPHVNPGGGGGHPGGGPPQGGGGHGHR